MLRPFLRTLGLLLPTTYTNSFKKKSQGLGLHASQSEVYSWLQLSARHLAAIAGNGAHRDNLENRHATALRVLRRGGIVPFFSQSRSCELEKEESDVQRSLQCVAMRGIVIERWQSIVLSFPDRYRGRATENGANQKLAHWKESNKHYKSLF